jgi:hypothetical protein
MVHGDGQISEEELAAFADDSWTPRGRGTDPSLLNVAIAGAPVPNCAAPLGSRTTVSWLRAGQRCRLSGTCLRSDELLELAAWNGIRDTARIHNALLRPLAPAIHRQAA